MENDGWERGVNFGNKKPDEMRSREIIGILHPGIRAVFYRMWFSNWTLEILRHRTRITSATDRSRTSTTEMRILLSLRSPLVDKARSNAKIVGNL